MFFLIQTIFLFCCIFWLLTWAGEYYFRKKQNKTKKNFYECGFKAIVDISITISFNFILLCVFLVLYDIEFIFLIPFYFNTYFAFLFHYIFLIIFIVFIILSLIYDWRMGGLNWGK